MSQWRTNRRTGQRFVIPSGQDLDRIEDIIIDKKVPKKLLGKYTIEIPLDKVEQVEYGDILVGRLDPQQDEDEGLSRIEDFEYAYRADENVPPVLLMWDRDTEEFIIRDGYHRVAALRRLGRKTVPAIVVGYNDE